MNTDDTMADADGVETPDIEIEAEQTTNETKTNIRNPELAIKALRKELAQSRKTQAEMVAARAEELANEKLEALRNEVEEKATTNAKKLLEKAQAQMEDAAKHRSTKMALKTEAKLAGVADFDDFYLVAEKLALSKVEYDADGEPTNVSDIVAELKQAKPHLFHGLSTSSNAKTPNERMETKVDYRAMSSDDFVAHLKKMGVKVSSSS